MKDTAMIRVRVDPELKRDAESILEALGISASDAIRMYYQQIRLLNGIPFELRLPNQVTMQAINEVKEGKGTYFESPEEGFKTLGLKKRPR